MWGKWEVGSGTGEVGRVLENLGRREVLVELKNVG